TSHGSVASTGRPSAKSWIVALPSVSKLSFMTQVPLLSAEKPIFALPYSARGLSQPSRRHGQAHAQPGQKRRQSLGRMVLRPFRPAAKLPQTQKRADIEQPA